jgi:hypothetical protein
VTSPTRSPARPTGRGTSRLSPRRRAEGGRGGRRRASPSLARQQLAPTIEAPAGARRPASQPAMPDTPPQRRYQAKPLLPVDGLPGSRQRGPACLRIACCEEVLYTLKAGPAGGLRAPSGPAAPRRSPGTGLTLQARSTIGATPDGRHDSAGTRPRVAAHLRGSPRRRRTGATPPRGQERPERRQSRPGRHRRWVGPPGTASNPVPQIGSTSGSALDRRHVDGPFRGRAAPCCFRLVLGRRPACANRRRTLHAPATPSSRRPRRRSERADCSQPRVITGATSGPHLGHERPDHRGQPRSPAARHLPSSGDTLPHRPQITATLPGSLTRKRSR